jgi:hypothetical protein
MRAMKNLNCTPLKFCIAISVQACTILLWFVSESSAQTWQFVVPMHFAREESRAITLLDGRILVAGGNDGNVVLKSCELYDPKANTWAATGDMNEGRYRFDMDILPDGRIIAVGGLLAIDPGGLVPTSNQCEIYDPKTERWASMQSMSAKRENSALLPLPNGKVFIGGGLDATNGNYLNSDVFFDPTSNSYQNLAPMLSGVFGPICFFDSIHNRILIQGGSYGGLNGSYITQTQVYDIATNVWSTGPPSFAAHGRLEGIRMPDGALLCVGGRTSAYVANDLVEALSPPYQSWTQLGRLTSPRWLGNLALVNNDSVLFIGGNNNPGVNTNVFDSTNWFEYGSDVSSEGPLLNIPRNRFVSAVTKISDVENPCRNRTVVLVFGGLSKGGAVLSSCEELSLGPGSYFPTLSFKGSIRNDSACKTISDSLILNNPTCQSVTIDSVKIVASTSELVVSAVVREDTILPHGAGLIMIALSSNDSGKYLIQVIVFTHLGQLQDTLKSILQYNLFNVGVNLSQLTLRMSGTICSASTLPLTIHNPSCDTVTIDSVVIGGVDAKLFKGSAPAKILPFDTAAITISIASDVAGSYGANVLVYCHAATQRDTLRTTIAATLTGKAVPSARVILKDVEANPGDTVSVPVLISGGAGVQTQGYRLHLRYNSDLLEMLEPEYSNTLSEGTTVDDINIHPGGADLFVPTTVTLNIGTLVRLFFRTYLTISDCTELEASSLIFSPDDAQFSTCILSTNLDSARVCIRSSCAGNLQRDLMAAREVHITRIETERDKLMVTLSSEASAHFEISDMMGRIVRTSEGSGDDLLAKRVRDIDIHNLCSGAYILRLIVNGRPQCRIFAVGR